MIGEIKEKYYQLKVTGKCGLMCDQSGEPLPYAIKKISEGTAFPELIEAWLKYGVLTEQEVKAIR